MASRSRKSVADIPFLRAVLEPITDPEKQAEIDRRRRAARLAEEAVPGRTGKGKPKAQRNSLGARAKKRVERAR